MEKMKGDVSSQRKGTITRHHGSENAIPGITSKLRRKDGWELPKGWQGSIVGRTELNTDHIRSVTGGFEKD